MGTLHLDLERTSYRPGEDIAVDVEWRFEASTESLLVTLLWFTRGKGDEDIGITEQEEIVDPGRSGRRTVVFRAPSYPPSFSGTLITLTWAVEAADKESGAVARTDIVIGPEAVEIEL